MYLFQNLRRKIGGTGGTSRYGENRNQKRGAVDDRTAEAEAITRSVKKPRILKGWENREITEEARTLPTAREGNKLRREIAKMGAIFQVGEPEKHRGGVGGLERGGSLQGPRPGATQPSPEESTRCQLL